MNNQFIKQVAHQAEVPLSIERDWNNGHEIIIVEGVKYHADFFRMNAMPRNDVLYAVRKKDDGIVHVTVIQNIGQAQDYFLEVYRQGDPAPTEEQHAV